MALGTLKKLRTADRDGRRHTTRKGELDGRRFKQEVQTMREEEMSLDAESDDCSS